MHILIITGGESKEREVSLKSADAVRRAAQEAGHTVYVYNISDGLRGISKFNDIDVIFPIIHGLEGEGGDLQAHLDAQPIPYLGSGAGACRVSFNKVTLKKLLIDQGIVTPDYQEVDCDSFVASPLSKQPYVLKPLDEGSSIDTYIVRQPDDFSIIETDVFNRHPRMLLEQLIDGQEITVSVLDNKPLPVIEIIPPKDGEFDFVNKYNGATQELCPPKGVSDELQAEAQRLALQIHNLIGARHLSRTDMMVRGDQLYVLELNTLPGLTEQSLFPLAARVDGMSMPGLIDIFVELSMRDS